ncbi:hypothetical protein Psuf_081950 [Phytohabitans suffuscus]|uniref:Uncharacterized protein n=1 Tax=Phytohabitans suffuscus TaxID=624315 RepID=A0A6F8YXR6_9ACTN|nr:hypothetical protein Psuf_081950 [Phytohabitans suffuscus]
MTARSGPARPIGTSSAGLPHHRQAGALRQARQPLAEQDVVVGDGDPQRALSRAAKPKPTAAASTMPSRTVYRVTRRASSHSAPSLTARASPPAPLPGTG